jgi:hypothetical protein
MARARPIRTHVCIIEITGLLFVKTILLRDLYKTRNFIATAMLSDVHITEFDENNYLLSDGSRFLGADNGNNTQSITSDVSCCDKVYFYSTCVCVGFYSCVHSMCNG